jgi:hypothetical protein
MQTPRVLINVYLAQLGLILNLAHHFVFNALLELIQIWGILFVHHVQKGITLLLRGIHFVLVVQLEHIHGPVLLSVTNAHRGLIQALPLLIAFNII